jgi:hypothetical protein
VPFTLAQRAAAEVVESSEYFQRTLSGKKNKMPAGVRKSAADAISKFRFFSILVD